MQPNQQDPTRPNNEPAPNPAPFAPQPGTPSDSNAAQPPAYSQSNIPEFLHLDPIPDPNIQNGKNNKVKIFIFAFIGLLILAVAGAAFAYFNNSQNDPQEKFLGALEKSMQSSFVSRKYEIKVKNQDITASMDVDTDLSNPAKPKSYVNHSSSRITDGSSVRKFDGEDIILERSEYFGLAKASSAAVIPKNMQTNQWYRFPAFAADRKTLSYDLNEQESRAQLNSVQGLSIIGNFDDGTREQLMNFVRSKNIYIVLSSQTERAGDKQLTSYVVQLDRRQLNELNKKAAELTGLSQVLQIETTAKNNEELKFWVDDVSGKFVKITYTIGKYKDDLDFEKTIDFSYPSGLSIIKPDSVKELPK